MITGSIINALAIILGSAAGMLLKWLAGRVSSVLPSGAGDLGHRLQEVVMQGVALCVLYIGINPSRVDVNVHPAKLEVKFSNEKPVFEAIYYTVRTALENNTTRPAMTLDISAKGSTVFSILKVEK